MKTLQNPGKRARSPSPPPGARGTGGGVGGRKGPAGDGAAAAAAAAAWLQLPPASTGGKVSSLSQALKFKRDTRWTCY